MKRQTNREGRATSKFKLWRESGWTFGSEFETSKAKWSENSTGKSWVERKLHLKKGKIINKSQNNNLR